MRTLLVLLVAISAASAREPRQAGAVNYKMLVSDLSPGDVLMLEPDDYSGGLDLNGLNGTPDRWIVITGPDRGEQPRFLGDPQHRRNTVEIIDCSYVAIRNLTIDGQDIGGVFGISAKKGRVHNIRIEGCTIVGHGAHQATVGISTKVPTWGWVIRGNTIVAAGSGMYLGDSDGSDPFVQGLIEHNLFKDARGYNVQIKHQNSRPSLPGLPTKPQRTIIRHNVFIKGDLPNESGARPNVLVGGFPDSGIGSKDWYEIYGNVFFHNHRESLLQAAGRVIIHDNVFVDCNVGGAGDAVFLTRHKKSLLCAYVYSNTFFDCDRGINFNTAALQDHAVIGNAFFVRGKAILGQCTQHSDNLVRTMDEAQSSVGNPTSNLGELDLYPLAGQLRERRLDLRRFEDHTDFDRDFNGASKGQGVFRGAYAGEGKNPGWQLGATLKPEVTPAGPHPKAGEELEPVKRGGLSRAPFWGLALALAALWVWRRRAARSGTRH